MGVLDTRTETLDVGRFIEEGAAFVGRHAEDFVDEALAHDGVAVLADIALHQEVEDVAQAHA